MRNLIISALSLVFVVIFSVPAEGQTWRKKTFPLPGEQGSWEGRPVSGEGADEGRSPAEETPAEPPAAGDSGGTEGSRGAAPKKPAPAPSKSYTVTLDSAIDLLTQRSMFGDYAEKTAAHPGSPYRYQGNGDTAMFQTSAFDDPLEARLKFEYTHESFGGLLQLRAAGDSGFSGVWDWQAWARPLSLWLPGFKVVTGNQAQRGRVERYQNFDDFLRTKMDEFGILFPLWQRNPTIVGGNNVDTVGSFPYGYDGPDQNKGFAAFTGTDTNDLFMPAGSLVRQPLGFLVEGNLNEVLGLLPLDLSRFLPFNLFLSLSTGGLFKSTSRPFKTPWGAGGTRANEFDDTYDPLEARGAFFGMRVEGTEIDFPFVGPLTVALVYKYASSALKKTESLDKANSLDEEIGNHTFGLYANMGTPLPGLTLSVGYSVLSRSWKNANYKDTNAEPSATGTEEHKLSAYREVRFPIYNAIDLRLNYTAIPRLNLTMNNNISFADMRGTPNKTLLYSYGWAYETQLNEDTVRGIEERKETYLGLYTALGAKYELTEVFIVNAQLANQFGAFTLKWEEDPLRARSNYFGFYAGINYIFAAAGSARASVRGGLALRYAAFSFQSPPAVSSEMAVNKAGYIDIGFPLGLKIEF